MQSAVPYSRVTVASMEKSGRNDSISISLASGNPVSRFGGTTYEIKRIDSGFPND